MRFELPVIWTSHDAISTGRLEVADDRVVLAARDRTFSFPLDSVVTSVVERGPARRLRGLPILSLRLAQGDCVEIASLGGAGSLHELALRVGARQAVASGT